MLFDLFLGLFVGFLSGYLWGQYRALDWFYRGTFRVRRKGDVEWSSRYRFVRKEN